MTLVSTGVCAVMGVYDREIRWRRKGQTPSRVYNVLCCEFLWKGVLRGAQVLILSVKHTAKEAHGPGL